MKTIKTALIAASMFSVLTGAALAGDFGAMPANYESAAQAYVSSRLADPHGARMKVVKGPYKAIAKFAGRGEQEVWAVDVRVRSRLPSGQVAGSAPYTIIFVNGRAVALKSDLRDLDKV